MKMKITVVVDQSRPRQAGFHATVGIAVEMVVVNGVAVLAKLIGQKEYAQGTLSDRVFVDTMPEGLPKGTRSAVRFETEAVGIFRWKSPKTSGEIQIVGDEIGEIQVLDELSDIFLMMNHATDTWEFPVDGVVFKE